MGRCPIPQYLLVIRVTAHELSAAADVGESLRTFSRLQFESAIYLIRTFETFSVHYENFEYRNEGIAFEKNNKAYCRGLHFSKANSSFLNF